MSAINPYQTPTEDLLDAEADEVGSIQYFSPASRIGRLRYFAHSALLTLVFYLVVIVLAVTVGSVMGDSFDGLGGGAFAIVLGTVYIPFVVMFWILMIQRLHDLDRSGWLSLLIMIPLVNLLIWLYIICWPGTKGSNRFGKRPPPNQLWHWFVGLLMPVAVVGLLAAVALPAYQDYVERAKAQQRE